MKIGIHKGTFVGVDASAEELKVILEFIPTAAPALGALLTAAVGGLHALLKK